MTNFGHFDRPIIHFGNAEVGYTKPAPPSPIIQVQVVPHEPILVPSW